MRRGNTADLPAAICPITQELMEDPVVCADGHSYERAAITQWLLSRDTSPCTNTSLLHRNVVPNFALRNLIAELRGVRRPVTLEEHAVAAKTCTPLGIEESDITGPARGTVATPGHGVAADDDAAGNSVISAISVPRRDEETAAAPEHEAEAAQPINPSKAVCRRLPPSQRGSSARVTTGKNALHWAMVEGPQAEQRQLWLLLNTELAMQPDQGGNLPLHYGASSGVSTAVIVACALANMAGLDYCNKMGRTPVDVAKLEGHHAAASVLEGMRNRHSNDLHRRLADGTGDDEAVLQLLRCRPELAAQRDTGGCLPLHVAAIAGSSLAVADECVAAYPKGPATRCDGGFLPHQLALEHRNVALAVRLASHVGVQLPSKPVQSILARQKTGAGRPGDGVFDKLSEKLASADLSGPSLDMDAVSGSVGGIAQDSSELKSSPGTSTNAQ